MSRSKVTDRYILNAIGEPVPCPDLDKWGQWFEQATNRKLALTEIDGVQVSTVFLGLDHNWGDGKPLLWETLVFGGELDGEMYRYETRLQAVRGHEEMVAKVRVADAAKVPGMRKIDLE